MTGVDFLASMPKSVAAQRKLLADLREALHADEDWRWFELGGSLARQAGDELSDIDCGAGIRDDAYAGAEPRIEALVGGLGGIVDLFHQAMGERVRHTIVQYEAGPQLSFVTVPASARNGLPPQAVALLDRDGILGTPWQPASYAATEHDLGEWTFLAWVALGDCAKYLRRGSVWEAAARVAEARDLVLRLWAAAGGAAYPAFGLTAVLDHPGLGLPPGAEAAVPRGLDPDAVAAAARACAGLLRAHGRQLPIADHIGRLLRE